MFRLFKNNSTGFTRCVGLLLVLLVFYCTTVEAGHRHGRIVPPASNATAVVSPQSGSGTLTTKSGCSDCLICQLHQNFSATLISVKPNADNVSRQSHPRTSDPVSIRSITNTPRSGRAPPQAN